MLHFHFYISRRSFKNPLNYWEFKNSISRYFFPSPAWFSTHSLITQKLLYCGPAAAEAAPWGCFVALPGPFQALPGPQGRELPQPPPVLHLPPWGPSHLWDHLGTIPRGALGFGILLWENREGQMGSCTSLLCQGSVCCSGFAIGMTILGIAWSQLALTKTRQTQPVC